MLVNSMLIYPNNVSLQLFVLCDHPGESLKSSESGSHLQSHCEWSCQVKTATEVVKTSVTNNSLSKDYSYQESGWVGLSGVGVGGHYSQVGGLYIERGLIVYMNSNKWQDQLKQETINLTGFNLKMQCLNEKHH